MEPHPIPQNVTAFEFHLIGDMTLKQFGYLAAGLGIAYFSFVVLLPIIPILAGPMIVFSALTGAAFAFLPINDRPLDHWVKAYFKAINSPLQGAWVNPFNLKPLKDADSIFGNRLRFYFTSLGAVADDEKVIIPKLAPATKLTGTFNLTRLRANPKPSPDLNHAQTAEKPPSINLPSSQNLDRLVSLANQSQLIQTRIAQTENKIAQVKSAAALDSAHAPSYNNQYQQILGNLQSLIKRAQELSEQISQISQTAPQDHITDTVLPKQGIMPSSINKIKNVRIVAPLPRTTTKLTLTSSPNVINGVVTDTSGNYLESVIVIIHNKAGIPVRALKTNKLGQFAGATPLPNAVYDITLEKDNLEFDTLEVNLSGQVLPPLQITPKSIPSPVNLGVGHV